MCGINRLTSDTVVDTWRITVPQLGMSCNFVMYGILALSTLHLARSRPEKRDFYVSQAKILHQYALLLITIFMKHSLLKPKSFILV